MFLVELVMQGIRGIRGPARLRFQSGFNFVFAGNEAGKTTAVDTMQRLLFPTGQANVASLVSRATPDASRGALVVCSDEGAYYRVIQDFSKRAVNLSKYNPSSKEFNLLYKDWDSTAEFMSKLTAGTDEEDFSRIFLLRREHYAGRPAAAYSAPAAFTPPVRGAAQPAAGASTANQARLAELREALKKAEEAADADYRHQSAKLALDEIRKKMQSIEDINQKAVDIEATLAELKGCETLPENLTELIEARERSESQKYTDTEELSNELEGLRLQYDRMPSVNLFTDNLFLGGAVLLVLSIVVGMFLLTEEYRQYFPIGVIVSLVLIAVAWYNGSRKNAQRRAIRNEMDGLEQQRIDVERKFVHEGAAIAGYMRALGVGTVGELKEKAENYRYFLSLHNDNEEARKRMVGDVTMEMLQEQYDKQYAEVLARETEAKALAQYAVDTYSIRQDIERLEGESSPGDSPWNSAAAVGPATDFLEAAPVPGQGGFTAELGIASRLVGIEMETLIPAVEAAAQRNLSAATVGKYVRIEVGHDGDPVVHTKDDARVNSRELSHGTKDLIYFCLRAGLIEALAGKRRLPFILDDALSGFDSARQQAACQILRTLGSKTQVVFLTSNPALRAPGDAASELK